MEQFITSSTKAPAVLGLDFDDTADAVQGAQEQARDNHHYGSPCFGPLHVSEGLSGRLLPTILQAHRVTGRQRLAVWKRVGERRRKAWPDPVLI